MLHNGVYIIEENGQTIGFATHSLLLFKMSPLTREIIQCYPHLESLSSKFSEDKIRQTVETLKKNNIIKTGPAPLPPTPPLPSCFSDIGLVLQTGQARMSSDILQQAVDFFLSHAAPVPNASLTFITEETQPIIPLINQAIETVQEKKQNTRFIIRTREFSPSPELHSLPQKNSTLLHINPKQKFLGVQSPFFKKGSGRRRHRNLLCALEEGTAEALDSLQERGIHRVHLDRRCRACQGKAPGAPAGLLIDRRYLKNNRSPSITGFMDHIPLLYPLIYSQRNYYGCAAGISYCAVAPDGGLYPCHTLTGSPAHCLGHIGEGTDEKQQRESLIQRVENRPACASCWARYLCGGGSSLKDREPLPAACETFRSFIRKLLLLYGTLDMNDKEAIRYSQQQMDRFLPHLKKLAAPAKTDFQGETLLTVRSDSMHPTLKAGDQVVVVPVKGKKIRIGDIVCYGRPVVCHRVIARFKRGGKTCIIEKGDNTIAGKKVLAQEITGRVIAIQNSKGRQDITRRGQRARQFLKAILSLSRHLFNAALFKIKPGGKK